MTTITEDYVSFETAKLLNIKGFKGEFHKHYWGYEAGKEFLTESSFNPEYDYPAPTLQIAMKWLREVHNIYYEVQLLLGDKATKYGDLQLGVYQLSSSGAYIWECCLYADTYEELYEKYIKYCLENLI